MFALFEDTGVAVLLFKLGSVAVGVHLLRLCESDRYEYLVVPTRSV